MRRSLTPPQHKITIINLITLWINNNQSASCRDLLLYRLTPWYLLWKRKKGKKNSRNFYTCCRCMVTEDELGSGKCRYLYIHWQIEEPHICTAHFSKRDMKLKLINGFMKTTLLYNWFQWFWLQMWTVNTFTQNITSTATNNYDVLTIFSIPHSSISW